MTMPITLATSDDVQIKKVTVTLTDAQIKTLPTQGVEVIPAPGAGKIVVPVLMFAYMDRAAGAYIGDPSPTISLVIDFDGDYDFVSEHLDIMSNGSPSYGIVGPATQQSIGGGTAALILGVNGGSSSHWENKPIVLGTSQGTNFTGGGVGNFLAITVPYVIFTIPTP